MILSLYLIFTALASNLVLILTWVYYSTQILLFGAELTQVYARLYGSQILPDKNSIHFNKH